MRSRSSTRTTPSPPTRSGSATTTGSLRWSPTSSVPMPWCCCRISTACTTRIRERATPGSSLRSAGPADLDGVVAGRGSHLGTGGMASKLSAALLASDAGVPVLLAAASDAATALVDASVGTVFAPRPERMSARRFWVRYAAESAGALTLDDGAVRAVVKQRRSLLPAGITAVSGRFPRRRRRRLARTRRDDGGPRCGRLRRSRTRDDARPVDVGSARRNAPSRSARRRSRRRLVAISA